MPDRPPPSALDQLDGLLREPVRPPVVRPPDAGSPDAPRRPDPPARTMPWAILAVAAILCVTIGVLLSRMLAAEPAPVAETPPVETARPMAQDVTAVPDEACAAIE